MVEEKMLIIGELTQGKELAIQLNQLDPVQSREACLELVEKIVSTYDKALSMLNLRQAAAAAAATDLVETFHQSSDKHTNCLTNPSKKRKTEARRNEQMRVCSADIGGESTKNDGQYRWRKYGQKDILGAKFPRAYYRCTHRITQGCLATKKVQKSDNDSSSFQISYKGSHTCIPHSISSSPDIPIRKKISKNKHDQISRVQAPVANALFNLQQGLKVETQNINSKDEIFNSISFTPFTQIESIENVESQFFFSKLLEDPAFLSPTTTTSDSDYINPFDLQLNNYGLNSILQSSESDPASDRMILTPTSGSESSFNDFDFDFCVDQVDFDTTAYLNEALGYCI